jgi:hypothetical protein
MSKRSSARVASKRAFARVHPQLGLVAHSPEVLGMAHCLDSPTQSPRTFGAYCFKLNFTPVSVIDQPNGRQCSPACNRAVCTPTKEPGTAASS